MHSNNPIKSDYEEIDLSQISKRIGNFFESISTKLFRGILFIKRNIIIIGVLLILGIGLGFLYDKNFKKYDNFIIVTPNFGSTDYLHSKIDLINSKINENDTVFLKETVGLRDIKKVKKIEIDAINDVYKFIDNKPENFELIKLLAEDGKLEEVIEDYTTSKNYPYHLITFSTSEPTTEQKTVQPILDYLNNTAYYKSLQNEQINNIRLKMSENDSVISQIDGVLKSFSSAVNGSQRNDKLIYYNENTQLNDVIRTRLDLVNELGSLRIQLVSIDKVIKDNAITINMKNTKFVRGKVKFLLPMVFIFLFIFLGYFKSFYNKQLEKHNS